MRTGARVLWALAVVLPGCKASDEGIVVDPPKAMEASVPEASVADLSMNWDNVDLAVACRNMIRDPFETDVDCGGLCPRCPEGRGCGQAFDCQKEVCVDGRCAAVRLGWRTAAVRGAPNTFVVADVTGDGRRDLVVGSQGGAEPSPYSVAVLTEGGGGLLQVVTEKSFGLQGEHGTVAIAVGDFDSDGRPDVAAGGTLSRRVWVLKSQGGGRFVESKPYEYQNESVPNYRPLAAGDFDGDGDADLVVGAADEGLLLYRNGGRGLAAPARMLPDVVWAMTAADIDGDKALDVLLSAGSVAVLKQRLSRLMLLDATWGDGRDLVAAGDFNGDGRLDVANARSVCLSDGKGGFLKGRAMDFSPSGQLVSGDFNGDGKSDLASSNSGRLVDYLIVAEGRASGELATSWRLSVPPLLMGVGAGDLNGDGRDELFVGVYPEGGPGEVRVYSVK